ncbi:uncharacterized protein LOC143297694 [Babylonia areolata]|uniref:uncharacterized protein LOC143297694 n=1 Tax=Babylonia areolata TaxID=304850 RepID=UPI003FD59B50
MSSAHEMYFIAVSMEREGERRGRSSSSAVPGRCRVIVVCCRHPSFLLCACPEGTCLTPTLTIFWCCAWHRDAGDRGSQYRWVLGGGDSALEVTRFQSRSVTSVDDEDILWYSASGVRRRFQTEEASDYAVRVFHQHGPREVGILTGNATVNRPSLSASRRVLARVLVESVLSVLVPSNTSEGRTEGSAADSLEMGTPSSQACFMLMMVILGFSHANGKPAERENGEDRQKCFIESENANRTRSSDLGACINLQICTKEDASLRYLSVRRRPFTQRPADDFSTNLVKMCTDRAQQKCDKRAEASDFGTWIKLQICLTEDARRERRELGKHPFVQYPSADFSANLPKTWTDEKTQQQQWAKTGCLAHGHVLPYRSTAPWWWWRWWFHDRQPAGPEVTVELWPVTSFLPDPSTDPARTLHHVGYRLATLAAVPSTVPVSRVRLAEAGFYSRGQRDEVICYSCGGRHSGWRHDDDPMQVHRRLSPHCQHVVEKDQEAAALAGSSTTAAAAGAPRPPPPPPPPPQQHQQETSQSQTGAQSFGHESTSSQQAEGDRGVLQQPGCVPRMSSGGPQGPGSIPQESGSIPQESSGRPEESGSVPQESGSVPQESGSSPQERGGVPQQLLAQPHSPSSQTSPSSTGASITTSTTSTSTTSTTTAVRSSTVALPAPSTAASAGAAQPSQRPPLFPQSRLDLGQVVYPGYCDLDRRRQTFTDGWDEDEAPALLLVIMSGFLYAGYDDCVTCFFCGVRLRNWLATDDPDKEHLRCSPGCGFLRASRGEDFVNDMLRRIGQVRLREIPLIRPHQSLQQVSPPPTATAARALAAAAATTTATTTTSSESSTSTVPLGNSSSSSQGTSNRSEQRGDAAVPAAVPVVVQGANPQGRLAQLQEGNQRLRQNLQCRVCRERRRDILFMPCGHLVVCNICAPSVRACIHCGANIMATARVYMN